MIILPIHQIIITFPARLGFFWQPTVIPCRCHHRHHHRCCCHIHITAFHLDACHQHRRSSLTLLASFVCRCRCHRLYTYSSSSLLCAMVGVLSEHIPAQRQQHNNGHIQQPNYNGMTAPLASATSISSPCPLVSPSSSSAFVSFVLSHSLPSCI